jgi:hypothetical protein
MQAIICAGHVFPVYPVCSPVSHQRGRKEKGEPAVRELDKPHMIFFE